MQSETAALVFLLVVVGSAGGIFFFLLAHRQHHFAALFLIVFAFGFSDLSLELDQIVLHLLYFAHMFSDQLLNFLLILLILGHQILILLGQIPNPFVPSLDLDLQLQPLIVILASQLIHNTDQLPILFLVLGVIEQLLLDILFLPSQQLL